MNRDPSKPRSLWGQVLVCANLLGISVSLLACEAGDSETESSSSGSSSGGESMPEEGAACEQDEPQCAQSSKLLVCESQVWNLHSCRDLCSDLMPAMCSLGCLSGFESETDECLCVPEGPECTGSQCEGNFLWVFPEQVKRSCASICAEQGFEIVQGCGFDLDVSSDRCRCLGAGTPCKEDDMPLCTGEESNSFFKTTEEIASCEDGVWVVHSCFEICGAVTLGCTKDSMNSGVCVCES